MRLRDRYTQGTDAYFKGRDDSQLPSFVQDGDVSCNWLYSRKVELVGCLIAYQGQCEVLEFNSSRKNTAGYSLLHFVISVYSRDPIFNVMINVPRIHAIQLGDVPDEVFLPHFCPRVQALVTAWLTGVDPSSVAAFDEVALFLPLFEAAAICHAGIAARPRGLSL